MKRSHSYSSSESDLDDTVDVEKESGDEAGYVPPFGGPARGTARVLIS